MGGAIVRGVCSSGLPFRDHERADMTHISSRAGRRLAAFALPALALLGPTARPAAARQRKRRLRRDTGQRRRLHRRPARLRPVHGRHHRHDHQRIVRSETFTENVTGRRRGRAASARAALTRSTQLVGIRPAFGGRARTDFVDLLWVRRRRSASTRRLALPERRGSNALPEVHGGRSCGFPPPYRNPRPVTPFVLAGLGLAGLFLRARSGRSRAA